jgi:hypothetical protein
MNPFEKVLGKIDKVPSTFDLEAYKKTVMEKDLSLPILREIVEENNAKP